MEDTAKYLVHADIVADGVVERSDVVGAIFGQTEGLLGDELDLRSLQRASKVGRINVEIDSENGQSFGQVTIATSVDRVETAILAAALETIDRVGPCRSNVAVSRIEDVRAAKRREVVARAKTLLGEFDESVISTRELVEEVRESVRVEDITEHEGLPAGPRVASSDAVIVVEGRADVLALLRYGIKNALAVEGTNVPDPVVALTADRTVTAFLDGDRGGDLILKELGQVGEIDYVAISPPGRSVEDLTRSEALTALREKVPYSAVADAASPREAFATANERPWPASDAEGEPPGREATTGASGTEPVASAAETAPVETAALAGSESAGESVTPESPVEPSEEPPEEPERVDTTETETPADERNGQSTTAAEPERSDDSGHADGPQEPAEPAEPAEPKTLGGHVRAVANTDRVRVLDAASETLVEAPAAEAFDAIAETDGDPVTVVLDGEVTQRVLDIAAQRGVERIVAREEGSFVKQPTSVRVRTASQLRSE